MRRVVLRDKVISAMIGTSIGGLFIVFIVIPARANVERPKVPEEIYRQEYNKYLEIKSDDLFILDETEGTSKGEATIYIVTKENNEQEIIGEDEETEGKNAEVDKAELEESKPYYEYTQEDVYLVGNTVFHEVGTLFADRIHPDVSDEEATRAAYMTASCIVNRAKMNYMSNGNTIESQLVRSQYESKDKIKAVKEEDVPEFFYQIAEDVMKNGPVVSERLIFQSEKKQGIEVDYIGNQHFGLLPENWEELE